MSREKVLVTGATGMAGSFIARRLLEQGYQVRAMVRRGADRTLLEGLEIEYVEGELSRPESFPAAVDGVDVVVHAAAHIGDWGPAEKYRAINVVALEQLLLAAEQTGQLKRWIQISSLGVYPARDHYGTDETTPADLAGLDGYTRTKAEAELVIQRHIRQHQLPAVVLRPGFIYGRGERHVVPQVIKRLENGTMKIIGEGRKKLNNTYAGNLADAVVLALENDNAVGETFNIRDERLVTRLEYIGAICDYVGKPMPRHVPLWVAKLAVGPIETLAKLSGKAEAPILTRARIKFMALNLDYSIDKAKRVLGYEGRVDFQEGIRETLDWVCRDRLAAKPQEAVTQG